MITTYFGTKLKQTQMFDENGKRLSVTVVSTDPMYITGIVKGVKNQIQFGFKTVKRGTKALLGQSKKAGISQNIRFFRSTDVDAIEETDTIGSEVLAEKVFAPGDKVRVTGISKGKGFAGVVKRHGFSGGPRTHGQSDRERSPGSIGQTTTPGRVYKGKRMAGRMGTDTVTVRGLHIVALVPEKHQMIVSGLVPGGKNSILVISKETR